MFVARGKKKNIPRIFGFLILLTLLSSLLTVRLSALSNSYLTFDFEETLDDWVPVKETYNSEFTIEHQVQESYTSSSKSAKLTGTTTYGLNFTEMNTTIELTNNSTLDFAWLLENDNGAYTGVKLHTSGFGSLYIYSLFYGIFANTSYAGILEIHGEETKTWYNHTVNLYEAYMQIYGDVPAKIDYLYLLNYPIGGGTNYCDLVTHFDNITFSEIVRENEETTFNLIFENDLNDWYTVKLTSNSEFVIDLYEQEGYDRKVAKLVGTTQYRFNFPNQEAEIKLNESSTISFEWMFENKAGAYSGFYLHTSDFGRLYIYAYFFGIFANTSTAGIIEFHGEETGKLLNHTVNLYDAYMQIFGKIPKTITHIYVINYPIGGGDYTTNQITFFDNIVIEAEVSQITETDFSIYYLVIIIPLMACMVIYRRGRRM